jgi:hypothetical protein
MKELIEKLREMCDSAPDVSLTTAYQLFGIKYAPQLRGTLIADLDRLSLKAGSENRCGVEIRKGVNIAPHVLLRHETLPLAAPFRKSNQNDDTIKLLAPKFRQVCQLAPKDHLVRTVSLCAIENREPLKNFAMADLGKLCVMSGIRTMHRNELRQGQKLSQYVEFKSYPRDA